MERILAIPEVAEQLQMSKSKVYDLVKRESNLSIRIGRNVRITESDREKWLEEQRRPARPL